MGGGLFNVTMRSGTNQYRGAGYDYLVNEAFNASTPFTNVLPRTRRNHFGFNLGGPVWIPKVYNGNDKTFFYYNREQHREFYVVNDTAITVPTAAYRAGDLSGAITGRSAENDPLGRAMLESMIFDPQSQRAVNEPQIRDQFPGNVIMPARFDKVLQAIQSLIPSPTNTAAALKYLPSFPNDRVTANESVTGNHTYKFGAELRTFGYPFHSLSATNGNFVFSTAQTAQPYAQSSTVNGVMLSFGYASLLLGLVNNGVVNPPADLKTGKQFCGFCAQDSWKITRKLTLDYGLRYDYDTNPREQYGHMPSASLSAATGTGSAGANNAFSAPGFGDAAMHLQTGVTAGHVLPRPNFSAGSYPNPNFPANVNGPMSIVDQNAGCPARQIQWSIGLQRELARNSVVEASYVGNRGAWWLSPNPDSYNALSTNALQAAGLDINNATDRAILRATIGSTAAGRFQNKLPYAGFPTNFTVAPSLRPYPQFTTGLAPLWAPQGRTGHDSLQAEVTQRVWHGLEAQYAFTWAKEMQLGTEAGTISDVFNRAQNKTISGFSRPLVSVISLNNRVPAPAGNRFFSLAVRDWAFGTLLTYASGVPILAPTSTNSLSTLLFRGTYYNRVPGVPLFLKDLNCHCIDPTKDLDLNKDAWSNPTDGQWGTANAYYTDYRYQRRPSESMNVGRVFSFKGRMRFTVTMNLTNVLNRPEMSNPSSSPSTAPTTGNVQGVPACTGVNKCVTGGFGFINAAGGASFLRASQGTLEMRLSF